MSAQERPRRDYNPLDRAAQPAQLRHWQKHEYNPLFEADFLPDYVPAPLPPPIALTLASSPEWSTACERLGHSPHEWQQGRLAGVPTNEEFDELREQLARLDTEQAAFREEWDAHLQWLVDLVSYDPARILAALGLKLCDCGDYCHASS